MKCVVYNRLSLSTVDNSSLLRQEHFCTKYASGAKLKVSEIHKEVCSAYKKKPNVLNSLVQRNNLYLIVYNVSRFSRSLKLGLEMLSTLFTNGGKVYFVDEGVEYAHDSDLDKLKIFLLKAELESDVISHRVKSSKKYLREKGKYSGGSIPFGYTIDKDNVIIPDLSESSIIKFIKECGCKRVIASRLNNIMRKIMMELFPNVKYTSIILYNVDGKSRRINKLSYANIADLLNSYDIKKRGCSWKSYTVKTAISSFNKQTVAKKRLTTTETSQKRSLCTTRNIMKKRRM